MSFSLRQRLLPYLLILAFIAAKVPRLNYPFYWDESWVYAPAIYAMHDHGPSLMPNAIPIEYSRGHPLLFQAGCALWMDIFGTSHVAMHAYALLLSALLAIATYELIRKLFNPMAALLALTLLLLNPDFFLYGTFLLTDLPLGLSILMALCYYNRKKYVQAALSIALAAYIKESGLVLIPVLLADVAWSLATHRYSKGVALCKAGSIAAGSALIFVFFALQKSQNGWFLNPGHTSLINTSIPHTADYLQQELRHLLMEQRFAWYWTVATAFCVLIAWQKKLWSLLILPASFWCFYVSTLVLSIKDAAFYVLFPAGIAGLVYSLKWVRKLPSGQSHFVGLSMAFSLSFLYFCAINFYEPRYMYPAVLLLGTILPAIFFDRAIAAVSGSKWLAGAGITLIIAAGMFSLQGAIQTCDMFRRMRLHQEVVDYFEERNEYNTSICARQFLDNQHLCLPYTGFLRHNKGFSHVTATVDSTTRYAIWGTIDQWEPYFDTIYRDTSFHLIKHFQEGSDHIDIYKRH